MATHVKRLSLDAAVVQQYLRSVALFNHRTSGVRFSKNLSCPLEDNSVELQRVEKDAQRDTKLRIGVSSTTIFKSRIERGLPAQ